MSGSYAKSVGKHHQPVLQDNPLRGPCRWCKARTAIADSYASSFCGGCEANGWTLSDLTLWRREIRDGVHNRLVREAAVVWLQAMRPADCVLEKLPIWEDFVKKKMQDMWR